jgi:hypothetical protein
MENVALIVTAMNKLKKKLKIDWQSKLIDLLIVIIGITIAFQLNNFSEASKSASKESVYLNSFYEENRDNESNLSAAYDFAKATKSAVDTLKQLLLSKDYQDDRLEALAGSMMALSDFSPSIVTMENITASGDFELISNYEYRDKLIDTYNSYQTTSQLEVILMNYVDQYVTPFFFENVRFSDFTSLKENFIESPEFENIVFGYDALLTQKLNGYEKNLTKLKELNLLLSSVVSN